MGQHIEVIGGKNVGAPFVLDDRHGLLRALGLQHGKFPAAGLGTGPAVAAPARQVIAEHAAPGMSHTHGPVCKSLQLDTIRQLLAQSSNAIQGQLPGQYDAPGPQIGKNPGGGGVHHIGLGADVQRQFRHPPAKHGKGTQVADDGGVHPGLICPLRVIRQVVQLVVIGQNVEGQIKSFARLMDDAQGFVQFFPIKIARGCPQAKAIQTAVYGVRPEADGGLQLLHAARRGQQLHHRYYFAPVLSS